MSSKAVIGVVGAVVLIGALTSTLRDSSCRNPVPWTPEPGDDLLLVVDPNPVSAGDTPTLTITAVDPNFEGNTSPYAAWQCWNGRDWVATHRLIFGGILGNTPYTQPADPPGVVPAYAPRLPVAASILIPDVPDGTYRIQLDGGSVLVVVE